MSMATSGSKAVAGAIIADNLISGGGSVSNFAKPTGVYFNSRSHHNCQNASLGLRNQATFKRSGIYVAYVFQITQRSGNTGSLVQPLFRSFHDSLSQCHSDSAVPEVSFNGLVRKEQITNFAVSANQNYLGNRTPKLQAGSCYLPHPDKEKTGGEDAHFICEEEQEIGVADGVGGWADVGVDAGEYARDLMSNSVVAIQDEPKDWIDPARVLEKAYLITKSKVPQQLASYPLQIRFCVPIILVIAVLL